MQTGSRRSQNVSGKYTQRHCSDIHRNTMTKKRYENRSTESRWSEKLGNEERVDITNEKQKSSRIFETIFSILFS